MFGPTSFGGLDRYDGAEVSRSKPPKMQVGNPVAIALNYSSDFFHHTRIRGTVEQNAAGVPQQSERPVRDHNRTNETGKRVHPKPTERPSQKKSDDHQYRNGGIGCNVDDRGAHVVVAMMGALRRRRRTDNAGL